MFCHLRGALKGFDRMKLFIYVPVHMQIPKWQKNITKQCECKEDRNLFDPIMYYKSLINI